MTTIRLHCSEGLFQIDADEMDNPQDLERMITANTHVIDREVDPKA